MTYQKKSFQKILLLFTFCVTTSLSAYSNYDASTEAVDNIQTPAYTMNTALQFPSSRMPTLQDTLRELKSYAEAVGRRFDYTLKDKKSKSIRPFSFNGGDIRKLKKRLREVDLYSTVLTQSAIEIYSFKSFTYPVDGVFSPKQLLKTLKNISGLGSAKYNSWKKEITIRVTPRGEERAREIIDIYFYKNKIMNYETMIVRGKRYDKLIKAIKRLRGINNINITTGQDNKISYTATQEVQLKVLRMINIHNKKARSTQILREENNARSLMPSLIAKKGLIPATEQGKGEYGSRIEKNRNNDTKVEEEKILLDKPYTIKTIVNELAKKTGKDYEVNFDVNIPVERGTEIKKFEDLNRYMKRKTGRTLKKKTLPSGKIIVLPGRKRN